MKKSIVGLIMAATLMTGSYANAGGHIGYGRVIGYTAAAALTAGVVTSLCCSRSYGYDRDSRYDRGYDRGYERAQYEQWRYDQRMRDSYYAPQPVYYAPPPPPRVIYVQQPQPVYYQQAPYGTRTYIIER